MVAGSAGVSGDQRIGRNDRVWLTWFEHRRSRNLAPAFGAEYVCMENDHPYLLRVLLLAPATLALLRHRRPRVVFVQNPSLALTALCCLVKPILGFRLVVDRHSNFKLQTLSDRRLKARIFHFLSRWTVRKADLTIVTNSALRELVESWQGTGVVLPDRLPEMQTTQRWADAVTAPIVAVFIASFGGDEPLEELLRAAQATEGLCHFYVTGNFRKAGIASPPVIPNVTFTGFLAEGEYVALLARADVIIVLTTEESLLNCGSYEAIALGKPMIVSDTQAIRDYFRRGCLYTSNDAEGIVNALREFGCRAAELGAEVADFRKVLVAEWTAQFAEVRRRACDGESSGANLQRCD